MTVRSMTVALLLSWVLASQAHAYPISPRTLWELTKEAELIVLAEVEAVGEQTRKDPNASLGPDVARLRIIEVWKGTKPEQLEVQFSMSVVCPAPPRYEPGLRVVAFLERSEGSWWTTGLSYGTHYPTDETAVEAYRQSVRLAIEAQASSQEELRVEWAVRTAVHPETRWDGLYMLAPEADQLHARYDSEGRKGTKLSPRQLKVLADAFIQAPADANTLLMVLALLQGHPSKAVDAAAISVMEMTVRDSDWLSLDTEWAMQLIARRLGKPLVPPEPSESQEAKALEEAEEYFFKAQEAFTARMKQKWESFKKANQLKPAPLRRSLTRGPSGVGGETPP